MSRNWSSAYSFAEGTNWSDADTTQRVYEYAVEPVTLQHLPDHALLLIETRPEGGRKLTPVECDPAIVTLDRVATTPLPDPPPRRPQPMHTPASQHPPVQPPGHGAMPYPPQVGRTAPGPSTTHPTPRRARTTTRIPVRPPPRTPARGTHGTRPGMAPRTDLGPHPTQEPASPRPAAAPHATSQTQRR